MKVLAHVDTCTRSSPTCTGFDYRQEARPKNLPRITGLHGASSGHCTFQSMPPPVLSNMMFIYAKNVSSNMLQKAWEKAAWRATELAASLLHVPRSVYVRMTALCTCCKNACTALLWACYGTPALHYYELIIVCWHRRSLSRDRRSEPLVGQRVPYVIVYGTPGLPLIQLVRCPHDLLADTSLRINATYYITKQILPPLGRIFSLMGVDVMRWYSDLPRVTRSVLVNHSLVLEITYF